jgi:transcriptional regulator with GAF, ATPase, and Fis domain
MQDNIYQSLLEINNILVREVTAEGLFKCLAEYLKANFRCDRVSLSIYEPATDTLSWFARAEGINITQMDSENTPLRGPLARMAIESRQVIIAPRLEEFSNYEAVQHMLDAGLRSALSFPLISRGNAIGAVVISFQHALGDEVEHLSDILKKMSSQVALAVDNMLVHAKLNLQNEYLHDQVNSLLNVNDIMHTGSRFFYNCATMQNIMRQTRMLAQNDIPVLITGETGTGKEFIAGFIHSYSRRSAFNFVKVSCPALSPTLFESELFGHAKGAFTGASSRRLGRYEFADKGSIFLDEIGDLDILLQAKLLHVLQDAKFERVGESKSISVDVRCISATNVDLHKLMREGRFRRDLFYRIGVTTLLIPPLRDREGELIPMLKHLLRLYTEEMKCITTVFHPETLVKLKEYHWPGNVRELTNLLARLLILHPGKVIGVEHILPLLEESNAVYEEANRQARIVDALGPPVLNHRFPEEGEEEPQSLADTEKNHIERILALTEGRVSGPRGAARLLGIHRSTLQYKLHKHGILPHNFK